MSADTALVGATPTQKSLYAEITQRIRAAGLLEARDRTFFLMLSLVLGGLLVVHAAALLVGTWWVLVVLGFFAGCGMSQVALLGHDLGHKQAIRRPLQNRTAGILLGNFLLGFSHSWWVQKHNLHHKSPNRLGVDPDIEHPIFAFDTSQLEGRNTFQRFLIRGQHVYYFLLIGLQAFSFRQASIRYLMKTPPRRWKWIERVGILGFYGWYAFLILIMGIQDGLIFGITTQVVFGIYNSLMFAPNHKDMPILREDETIDPFLAQVLTSRNVTGGWVMTFALGGLNYQIEHHLFQSMPRVNLGKARPIVRQFCEERGVPYEETNPFASYRRVILNFRRIARLQKQGA